MATAPNYTGRSAPLIISSTPSKLYTQTSAEAARAGAVVSAPSTTANSVSIASTPSTSSASGAGAVPASSTTSSGGGAPLISGGSNTPTTVTKEYTLGEKYITEKSPVFELLNPAAKESVRSGVKYSGVTGLMLGAGTDSVSGRAGDIWGAGYGIISSESARTGGMSLGAAEQSIVTGRLQPSVNKIPVSTAPAPATRALELGSGYNAQGVANVPPVLVTKDATPVATGFFKDKVPFWAGGRTQTVKTVNPLIKVVSGSGAPENAVLIASPKETNIITIGSSGSVVYRKDYAQPAGAVSFSLPAFAKAEGEGVLDSLIVKSADSYKASKTPQRVITPEEYNAGIVPKEFDPYRYFAPYETKLTTTTSQGKPYEKTKYELELTRDTKKETYYEKRGLEWVIVKQSVTPAPSPSFYDIDKTKAAAKNLGLDTKYTDGVLLVTSRGYERRTNTITTEELVGSQYLVLSRKTDAVLKEEKFLENIESIRSAPSEAPLFPQFAIFKGSPKLKDVDNLITGFQKGAQGVIDFKFNVAGTSIPLTPEPMKTVYSGFIGTGTKDVAFLNFFKPGETANFFIGTPTAAAYQASVKGLDAPFKTMAVGAGVAGTKAGKIPGFIAAHPLEAATMVGVTVAGAWITGKLFKSAAKALAKSVEPSVSFNTGEMNLRTGQFFYKIKGAKGQNYLADEKTILAKTGAPNINKAFQALEAKGFKVWGRANGGGYYDGNVWVDTTAKGVGRVQGDYSGAGVTVKMPGGTVVSSAAGGKVNAVFFGDLGGAQKTTGVVLSTVKTGRSLVINIGGKGKVFEWQPRTITTTIEPFKDITAIKTLAGAEKTGKNIAVSAGKVGDKAYAADSFTRYSRITKSAWRFPIDASVTFDISQPTSIVSKSVKTPGGINYQSVYAQTYGDVRLMRSPNAPYTPGSVAFGSGASTVKINNFIGSEHFTLPEGRTNLMWSRPGIKGLPEFIPFSPVARATKAVAGKPGVVKGFIAGVKTDLSIPAYFVPEAARTVYNTGAGAAKSVSLELTNTKVALQSLTQKLVAPPASALAFKTATETAKSIYVGKTANAYAQVGQAFGVTKPLLKGRASVSTETALTQPQALSRLVGTTTTRTSAARITPRLSTRANAVTSLVSLPVRSTQTRTTGTTNLVTKTNLITQLKTNVTTETNTEIVPNIDIVIQRPVTPWIDTPLILPVLFGGGADFGGGFSGKRSKGFKGKRPSGYKPSVSAMLLGIKSKKIKSFFTGFEVRPIPIKRFKK